MWLWFVLGGLLIGIAWALKFTLDWPLLIPIIATAVVVVAVATIGVLKWYFALRAAKKLQEVIEKQGTQQALNARPERRAEIQELRKQLLGGLDALKKSRLGRGGKRGGAALYTMPWYMIIGPPGAGKTTALTHSGLVFPYGSSTGPGGGGGVRGVGGTRNCDWWFTNEAILLDTAGRYTTEQDDREEWVSFLNFLKKYRPKRPINGVIIAISISELIDANEMQIEAIAKKLRSRIDEVAGQLHLVLPVYLLFTKVDLIAGFSEFFGDLKKSDRSKCWGSTIKLELPKNEPGRIFGAEFDVLVKQLHARGLKRLTMEQRREVREKLYQFPLEFTGLKKNLADLIATTFQPNTMQGTPIFRGFYFTSGTQEGRPMDRVLERMSAAMGIRSQAQNPYQQTPYQQNPYQQNPYGAQHPYQQPPQQPVVESKSYFLHDLFMNIIFPDGDIAVRSAVEERRQLFMKIAIAGATFALAAILALPGLTSYSNNKSFLAESDKCARSAAKLDWGPDMGEASDSIHQLDCLLDQLKQQEKFESEGVPLTMGWGMFVANKVERPSLKVYASQMVTGFANPTKRALEDRLRASTGKDFLGDWIALRQYLMLGKIDEKNDHLDVEWATGRFTASWASILKKGGSSASEGELKVLARPHVRYYFELLKEGRITNIELDGELISKARASLQATGIEQRYYDLLVRWLEDERIDDANDPTYDNLVFSPLDLPRSFQSRPNEVLRTYLSKSYLADKTNYKKIMGPYTAKGYAAVLLQMQNAEGLLRGEAWVVPMTSDETSANIPQWVAKVKDRYEQTYITQWLEFFADIKMKVPTSPVEAIDIYRMISEGPTPFSQLMARLQENTQFKEGEDPLADQEQANTAKFFARIDRYKKIVAPTADLENLGKRTDKIPAKFKATVEWGLGSGGDVKGHKYTDSIVKDLKNTVIKAKDSKGENFFLGDLREEIEAARASSEQLLNGCDATCVEILKPMLLDPLTVGDRPTLGNPTPQSVGPNAPPKKGISPNQTKLPKLPPGFKP
ncbi:MAG: type VI secretion system membrane subunit TssM [Polyangiaceae bacterium]|nr:type VI secretion system membrane subunit TssM [Polyangiaceae bacterium]